MKTPDLEAMALRVVNGYREYMIHGGKCDDGCLQGMIEDVLFEAYRMGREAALPSEDELLVWVEEYLLKHRYRPNEFEVRKWLRDNMQAAGAGSDDDLIKALEIHIRNMQWETEDVDYYARKLADVVRAAQKGKI